MHKGVNLFMGVYILLVCEYTYICMYVCAYIYKYE